MTTAADNAPVRHHALNALFASLADAVVPSSCDVVVIEGLLDHERLRAAILATLARHPILNRPLDPSLASDGALPLDLRVHALDDDDPARIDEYLIGLIWDEPLPPEARPIRFHVVETAERTYFQTIHTHVYADATACYAITEQIAAAYAGDALPLEVDDVAESDVVALASAPLSIRERLDHYTRGLAQTAHDLAATYGGLVTPPRDHAGRRRLARFVLSVDETKKLRAAARGRGCSIHAFFQLAFLRAATDYNRARGETRSSVRVWDFFSLRPLLGKAKDRYDCLALVYPVDLDAAWSDDETLAHCTRNVERMRSGDLVTHAHRFDALFRIVDRIVPRDSFMSMWRSIFKTNVFLTNPGVCPSPLPRFGDAEVSDYVTFPQLFFPADLTFVFSTFRGSLRVLVTYDEDAFGATFHRDVFAPFLANLGGLAAIDFGSTTTRDGFVASWIEDPRRIARATPSPMKQSA